MLEFDFFKNLKQKKHLKLFSEWFILKLELFVIEKKNLLM